MRTRSILVFLFVAAFSLSLVASAEAGRRVRVFGAKAAEETPKAKPKAKNGDEKPFDELIKDHVVIEGLFTFYHDTVKNSLLMAIKPEQIGPVFLCGESRTQSSSAFTDNGAMGRTYPFYFQRIGKSIQMMEKNLRFRADSASPLLQSVENAVTDHLITSVKIKSQPQDSTEAVLVAPDKFFLRDVQNLGHFLNATRRTGVGFDSKNSHFADVKSFPENTEIDVRLHYSSKRPVAGVTMQNPYSVFHTVHFTIAALPETDYVPRVADERVGFFQTIYQDFSNLDTETPYVRYINRWHLKKKDPDAAMSEPVEPIVFWVENTVPEEYRQAVVEAIEFWNPAFEKIGFKNALVAKIMPDTAEWDPADARYNVIRWIISPGAAYAVGPSRANPFTGQIYDADIRFSVDWVRYMFNRMEMYIDPVAFDGSMPEEHDWYNEEPAEPLLHDHSHNGHLLCNYGHEAAERAAFDYAYLSTVTDDLADKDGLVQKFVHTYLREILAHEVGHTLGFRHNFKASTIYTFEQINNPEWTRKHGTVGTIMDYASANIAGPGMTQGDFYAEVPGPYDDWMVEYGYSDLGSETPWEEIDQLKKIASKSGDPRLVYATDEDVWGWSMRALDPYANLHDLGSDPLAFAERKITQTKHLWNHALENFEKPGNRYQKVYTAFVSGWRGYRELAMIASKYPGGLTRSNHHVGDPGTSAPFKVVPTSEVRRAMKMLREELFAPNAFDLPEQLINRLQPERLGDFTGRVWRMPQVDYPLHQTVLNTQRTALARLYSPQLLGRLVNNLERYREGEEVYTMLEMFTEIRRSIWGELVGPKNVNSFRRQLQLAHLEHALTIFLGPSARYPADARTLAGNDLEIIENAAKSAVRSGSLDDMTKAHFKEVIRQIEAARSAERSFLSKF